MKKLHMHFPWAMFVVFTALMALYTATGVADTAAEIDREVDAALEKLYASSPAASELSTVAKGILVFPDILKAGLVVGGQYGVGALRKGGQTAGYYNTTAASFGLQAGAQSFGYALFFTTDEYLGGTVG